MSLVALKSSGRDRHSCLFVAQHSRWCSLDAQSPVLRLCQSTGAHHDLTWLSRI